MTEFNKLPLIAVKRSSLEELCKNGDGTIFAAVGSKPFEDWVYLKACEFKPTDNDTGAAEAVRRTVISLGIVPEDESFFMTWRALTDWIQKRREHGLIPPALPPYTVKKIERARELSAWAYELAKDVVEGGTDADFERATILSELGLVAKRYADLVGRQTQAAESRPFAWAREWGGDVSDLDKYVVVFNEDEKDEEPGWFELYVEPQQPAVKTGRLKAAAVPEGWKLVPVELTEEMFAAANEHLHVNAKGRIYAAWDGMLAAAPQPPTAEPKEKPAPQQES